MKKMTASRHATRTPWVASFRVVEIIDLELKVQEVLALVEIKRTTRTTILQVTMDAHLTSRVQPASTEHHQEGQAGIVHDPFSPEP